MSRVEKKVAMDGRKFKRQIGTTKEVFLSIPYRNGRRQGYIAGTETSPPPTR